MSSSNQKGNGSEQRVAPKRRRRSNEEKRAIAEASLKPGTSIREVAEAYGVHPSQIGKWRRLYQSDAVGDGSSPALLAVRITDSVEQYQPSRPSTLKASQHGIIHIEFERARVSIEGPADAGTLRAVMEYLAG